MNDIICSIEVDSEGRHDDKLSVTSTLWHYNNENAKPFTKKMIKFKIKCQMG